MDEGFVETPDKLVDLMVSKLFENNPPGPDSRVLDPGCGGGPFIHGILRYCRSEEIPIPRITGVELNKERFGLASTSFEDFDNVTVLHSDFLTDSSEEYDYIIGNPPYVSILNLPPHEKSRLKRKYSAATNRFDLYMLFFEQSLDMLTEGGRLVFITPEKFLYVQSAGRLREIMSGFHIDQIQLVEEDSFGNRTTYPVITTLDNRVSDSPTVVIRRDGTTLGIALSGEDNDWMSVIADPVKVDGSGGVLLDICQRVSCGIATGSDKTFVIPEEDIPTRLSSFAYPTISGSQLTAQEGTLITTDVMLIPYSIDGTLMTEGQASSLLEYFDEKGLSDRLRARSCARRKPWYAFHDNAPLPVIQQPKILCKDITAEPRFWMDENGSIVPRHTVYYIVPKNPAIAGNLLDYLNSPEAHSWLTANCQRAANGFIRIQSAVLKRLPIPSGLNG